MYYYLSKTGLTTMRANLLIMGFTLLCISNVHAEIYTCKDAKGETIFTDSPSQCANAEEIKVDKLPTLTPSKSIAIPASSQSDQSADDKEAYKEVVVTAPSHESVMRNNQGDITINFRSSPALQTRKGHQYLVTVSGKEIYKGTSTIAIMKNVDRGTHTVVVKIIASDGNVVKSSSPVSFTLQRFSSQQNNSNTGSSGGDSGSDSGSDSGGDSDANQPTINQNDFSFPGKLPSRPPAN